MRLERRQVGVDAIKHDRGNRNDHARRRELPLGQDMVDEAAVQATISVLQRVDIHETEGGGGGLQNGIKAGLAHPLVSFEQTLHKLGQVQGPRTDEFRQGITIVIALTQEDTVWTKAWPHEPCLFDQDAVKAHDFIEAELGPASLHDGAAPTLQPVPGRALAFYFETRPAVG